VASILVPALEGRLVHTDAVDALELAPRQAPSHRTLHHAVDLAPGEVHPRHREDARLLQPGDDERLAAHGMSICSTP